MALRRAMMPVLAATLLAVGGCGDSWNRPQEWRFAAADPMTAYSDEGHYLPLQVGEGVVADPDSPIPDVPRPVGFVALASQSSSFSDGNARVVEHVYQGRVRKPSDVTAFYRQQLTQPGNDWTLVDQYQATGGGTVLSYVKGPEQMTVTLRTRRGVTTIVIRIGPRQG